MASSSCPVSAAGPTARKRSRGRCCRGCSERRKGIGEGSRGGVASAYLRNATDTRLLQPHATAEVPKPRVSPERGVLGFAAHRRRQIDIALVERSPQPGHGLLTLAEYDVLASEGDRWNESALRSRPQPLEGSGGPE